MSVSVATWNINSVRLRIDLVGDFLDAHRPDILCLQEIKCREAVFPRREFERRGYGHILVNGQKGYHGVAIVSKHPFEKTGRDNFCGKQDARHVSVTLDGDAGLAEPLTLHIRLRGARFRRRRASLTNRAWCSRGTASRSTGIS